MFDDHVEHIDGSLMGVIFEKLPPNEGLLLDQWFDKTYCTLRHEKLVDLERLNASEVLFHVVCMLNRPCFADFLHHLEFHHYPPLSPNNVDLKYRMFKWDDFSWGIATIPLKEKQHAYTSAKAVNSRLANGVPHIFSMPGRKNNGILSARQVPSHAQIHGMSIQANVRKFPLCNNNVFTLEPIHNNPGGGPVIGGVGSNNPDTMAEINDILRKYK